jgi:hypothetical protein
VSLGAFLVLLVLPAAAPDTARIEATVRSGPVRYHLEGRLDTSRGYRLCADIGPAPLGYLRHSVLWLEGRNGSYGTLTAHGRRCTRDASWFDDHPPTLPLSDLHRFPSRAVPGAEDYLHAALLGLTGLSGRAVTEERLFMDFAALDREPRRRDEDGWTLRPLLRSLGTQHVEVHVNSLGIVDRLRFVAPADAGPTPKPVTVGLRLWRFGREPRVPHVVAYGIE